MGKLYNNAITTTAGFNYAAQQPLDDREVVQSYSDLLELVNSSISYEGIEVYVIDNKKSYKLIDGDWKSIATEQYVNNQIQQQIQSIQVNKADKMAQTSITSNTSTYIQTNSGKIDFKLYTYKYGRLASGNVKIENKNLFKEENYTYHFDYEDTDTNLTKYKPGQTYEKNGLTISVDNQGVILVNGIGDNDVNFNIASGVKFPFVNTYYTISGMDEYVGGINVKGFWDRADNPDDIIINPGEGTIIYNDRMDSTFSLVITFSPDRLYENVQIKPQIEIGIQKTSYEIYTSKNIEIDWTGIYNSTSDTQNTWLDSIILTSMDDSTFRCSYLDNINNIDAGRVTDYVNI